MANDNDKPEASAPPEATPSPSTPSSAAPAAGAGPSPTGATAPAGATARPAPGGASRGGPGSSQGKEGAKRPFQRSGDGGPRRREREPMPALPDDMDFAKRLNPNVRDLDAEIAGELEAALQGMDDKNLYGADSSRRARDQAAAQADQGRKKGKVISIHGPDVFIDVPGGRSQGVLTLEQFPDGPPAIGTEVEITIEGYDPQNGLLILSRLGAAMRADWSTVAEGMTVEARVLETNKGGLTVDINGIRAFMPISQIDRFRVENIEQFVNQKLLCIVTDVDQQDHNLVVSRRALLEKEREEQKKKLWEELQEGQIRSGVVGNVRDFGAFVDLGGVDGLLHVSEISWKRVPDATQVLQVGQLIKVVVLKIDREQNKVSLGLKQLEASPWDNIQEKYASGRIVTGTVTRTMDFGAFVELEPGVEGLIHISELARNKVWRVTDIVKPAQEVEVKILSVDPNARRISLSLREAIKEPVKKSEEEEETETVDEPVKPRPVNRNLRGGIGTSTWIGPDNPNEGEPTP